MIHAVRQITLAALTAAAAFAAQAQAILPGTASYLERIALPPNAALDVSLEDISLADAPAVVIGTAHVAPAGNPPIRFGIGYDPEKILANHRYAVRATIKLGDKLLFTTDTLHPVSAGSLAQGEPSRVDVLLRSATSKPAAAAASAPVPDAPLINTYWKLTELGGQPVKVEPNQREPHFVLHASSAQGKRIAGSDGCNRFTGGYLLDGSKLSLDKPASTMMACLQGAEQAQAYLKALSQVAGWHVSGNLLDLQDADGKVLARFEMRLMK
jgi:putative lipoprotein